MRLFILLLLLTCGPTFSAAAPPAADPATVQQTREDVIRLQERLDAIHRDLDRQRQDQAELESRVKALVAGLEKGQEEAQQRQDNRISLWVTIFGVCIAALSVIVTVGGVALGVAGWFQIRSYAEKWEKDAAAKLKALEDTQTAAIAEMEKRSQVHLAKMDEDRKASAAKLKETTDLLDRTSASVAEQGGPPLSAADQTKLSAAAQEVDTTPEPDRSPTDWLVLGNKALADEDYNAALVHFDEALSHPAASNIERARALNGRGITFARQKLYADATAMFDLAFQVISADPSSKGRTHAGRALFNKGLAVGHADSAEAIAIYDEIIRRYDGDSQPDLRELVAAATIKKGMEVGKTDSAAAIAIYDDIVRRYGDDSQPGLREQIARAFLNKGIAVSKTDPTAAITHFEDILAKYGDDPALKSVTDRARAQIAKLRKG